MRPGDGIPFPRTAASAEGIAREREMLKDLKSLSDFTIDTIRLQRSPVKRGIKGRYERADTNKLQINILSFGYKHGYPYDADMIFDVRFLPNPFFIDELKDLTGLTKR